MNTRNDQAIGYTKDNLSSVVNYWTPERMKNARPISNQFIKEPSKKQSDSTLNEDIPIILPSNIDSSASFIGEPYPADINTSPHECGGRFFFTIGEGETAVDHYGSAEFVGHCLMILTAAHCVRDRNTGDYYNNLCFAHGYQEINGEIIQTPFPVEHKKTLDDFVGAEEGSAINDYAFCRVQTPFSKWLGLAINNQGTAGNPIKCMGYPLNYGEGKIMYAVDGAVQDTFSSIFTMEGNPMTNGASGGALMVDLENAERTYKNMVVGVFAAFTSEEVVGSPLFDQNTFDLFNEVLDVSPDNPRDVCHS